jgi:hypothetical protein
MDVLQPEKGELLCRDRGSLQGRQPPPDNSDNDQNDKNRDGRPVRSSLRKLMLRMADPAMRISLPGP